MSTRSVLILTSLLAALSLPVVPSVYAWERSDTINPLTILDADVGLCINDPALIVEGPAALDLSGHKVGQMLSTNPSTEGPVNPGSDKNKRDQQAARIMGMMALLLMAR